MSTERFTLADLGTVTLDMEPPLTPEQVKHIRQGLADLARKRAPVASGLLECTWCGSDGITAEASGAHQCQGTLQYGPKFNPASPPAAPPAPPAPEVTKCPRCGGFLSIAVRDDGDYEADCGGELCGCIGEGVGPTPEDAVASFIAHANLEDEPEVADPSDAAPPARQGEAKRCATHVGDCCWNCDHGYEDEECTCGEDEPAQPPPPVNGSAVPEPDWSKFVPTDIVPYEDSFYDSRAIPDGTVFVTWGRWSGPAVWRRQPYALPDGCSVHLAGPGRSWTPGHVRVIRHADGRWAAGYGPDGPVAQPAEPSAPVGPQCQFGMHGYGPRCKNAAAVRNEDGYEWCREHGRRGDKPIVEPPAPPVCPACMTDTEGFRAAGVVPFEGCTRCGNPTHWRLPAEPAPPPAEPATTKVVCGKCKGKGYHHGFGAGGHDPDWCTECGGAGEWEVAPAEPAKGALSALTKAFDDMEAFSAQLDIAKFEQGAASRDAEVAALREELDATRRTSDETIRSMSDDLLALRERLAEAEKARDVAARDATMAAFVDIRARLAAEKERDEWRERHRQQAVEIAEMRAEHIAADALRAQLAAVAKECDTLSTHCARAERIAEERKQQLVTRDARIAGLERSAREDIDKAVREERARCRALTREWEYGRRMTLAQVFSAIASGAPVPKASE
jgi:hypothetical protein